jgi:protein-S-isoprenylcysteine O-methyltransferase Ste14
MPDETSRSRETADRAQVAFHPPVLLGVFVVLGFVAHGLAPWPISAGAWLAPAGLLLISAALALFAYAALTMRRYGASIPTSEPTESIVAAGPFRFSRNPIYLSMVALLVGLAAARGSYWFIVLAAIAMALLTAFVIKREERYLEHKFGERYLAYKRRVRRWL